MPVRNNSPRSWLLICTLMACLLPGSSMLYAQDNKDASKGKKEKSKNSEASKKGATAKDGKSPADGAAKADPKAANSKAANSKAANSKAASPKAGGTDKAIKDPNKAPPVPRDRHRFKLLTIEEKTSSLKEKIFRSKAKLMLLQESLLQGAISTGKVVLVHVNKMGSSFYLRSISYTLNGNPVFTKTDYQGSLNKAKAKKFVAFTNTIQPGRYTLSVELGFRGNGMGVFSYLKKYKFRVVSSYTFKALEGKSIEVSIVAYEKSPFTTQLTERPTVRYDVKIREITTKRKNLQKSAKK